MTTNPRTADGLFLAEGTSDMPLAPIVERLLFERDVSLRLSAPDFGRIPEAVGHSVGDKLAASLRVLGGTPSIVVIHRDANSVGIDHRRREIADALIRVGVDSPHVPVIPIRSTEAWLLLDEDAIRTVAGNPGGRMQLHLPTPGQVESVADAKQRLQECLVKASGTTGRRRAEVRRRFPAHRRQLLERLDIDGAVTRLESWQRLVADVDRVAHELRP